MVTSLIFWCRFFLIYFIMIRGYGMHIASLCRYMSLRSLLLTVDNCTCNTLTFLYSVQSHPAFVEYHDLLQVLEEKLSSSEDLEETWWNKRDYWSSDQLLSSIIWCIYSPSSSRRSQPNHWETGKHAYLIQCRAKRRL